MRLLHGFARSLLLVLGLAAPAGATTLFLDPALSSLTPSVGPAQSLSGGIVILLGAEPPLSSNTTFELTGLGLVTSGGQLIGLDPALAHPGAGVLSPAGNFLIPNLFLRLVDGAVVVDLTVPDVTGSYGALPGCPAAPCLATSFAIDTQGPAGIVSVQVFAAVPEPASAGLLAAALAALAALRRARGGCAMSRRSVVFAVAAAGLASLAASTCNPPAGLVNQDFFRRTGFQEIHTPGSGDPAEIAPTAAVSSLLGPDLDLNQVDYVRSRWNNGTGTPPRVILIVIPGFLGGATTFDPLARDLVAKFNGTLEVWAVDRRPNQLEDRLGARFALAGALQPACTQSPPLPACSIFVGAQFYAPDTDAAPLGDFPGPGDLDLDLDGVLDPQGQLQDDFGVTRGPLVLAQNDARFMAYWGLDTYFRDWKLLIEDARAVVGASGLVLLGGHSQGTTWASTFAAYDFDPDPAIVVSGHSLIDGLLLLEGGGAGTGAATKPTFSDYQNTVAALDDVGGPEVFLANFSGIPLQALGTSGEVSAIAGLFQPNEPALIQRTPTFGTGIVGLLLSAPSTNRSLGGLFLDDDFSPIGAFRASLGFSDNGPNTLTTLPGFAPFYLAGPATGGGLRQWKEFDDPTLPSCPPNAPNVSPGCALLDNGPPSDPGNPAEPPRVNGREVETTSLTDFFLTQVGKGNGFEWYFASGRPNLDFAYGRDASVLVAQALAVDPSNEGPLVVTQNASMNVPVLAIGGSNGLTPEPKSFAGYLGSIATPPADKRVVIVEGYAHLDVINARNNKALPPIVDFVTELLQRKLLASF